MNDFEQYRVQLTGYCYRMLGSAFEAEDAVQETLLRAWRGKERFEGRSHLRTWLYRIATNVCLDMLKQKQRRTLPLDFAETAVVGPSLGPPLPDSAWIQPIPDNFVLVSSEDPAVLAERRESIRLAFVAALQHLPPRQRAVLILREVLHFTASEVARLLGTSIAAVNSAFQRARATLKNKNVTGVDVARPGNGAQEELLNRYVDAFERSDFDALVALLHEDATMSMPPFTWWVRGRGEIYKALLGSDGSCHGSRFVRVYANGQPAFGQYTPSGEGGAHRPWALQVLEIVEGQITGITSFLSATDLFPLFDLPAEIDVLHGIGKPHRQRFREKVQDDR